MQISLTSFHTLLIAIVITFLHCTTLDKAQMRSCKIEYYTQAEQKELEEELCGYHDTAHNVLQVKHSSKTNKYEQSSWLLVACTVVEYMFAVVCIVLLGSDHVALLIALFCPRRVHFLQNLSTHRVFTLFLFAIGLTTCLLTIYTILVFSLDDVLYRTTSIHAPPNINAVWYIRQLTLPAFERFGDAVRLQLPSFFTMIIALMFMYNSYNVTRCVEINKRDDIICPNKEKKSVIKHELRNEETVAPNEEPIRDELLHCSGNKSKLSELQQIKRNNAEKNVSTNEEELKELVEDDHKLFTDIRVVLVHFAIMFSLMLRHDVTLTECCAELLLLYSSLNPLAHKKVYKDEHVHQHSSVIDNNDDDDGNNSSSNEHIPKDVSDIVITYTPHMRVRTLVPAYLCFISLMLQIGFYYKWVVWISTNANWLFFAQIVFCSGIALFIVLWYSEVVENVISTTST